MLIEKRVFSATEAAVILGVSTPTVYQYLASGALVGFKFPGHNAWRITEDALLDFLHRQEMGEIEKMRNNRANQKRY